MCHTRDVADRTARQSNAHCHRAASMMQIRASSGNKIARAAIGPALQQTLGTIKGTTHGTAIGTAIGGTTEIGGFGRVHRIGTGTGAWHSTARDSPQHSPAPPPEQVHGNVLQDGWQSSRLIDRQSSTIEGAHITWAPEDSIFAALPARHRTVQSDAMPQGSPLCDAVRCCSLSLRQKLHSWPVCLSLARSRIV